MEGLDNFIGRDDGDMKAMDTRILLTLRHELDECVHGEYEVSVIVTATEGPLPPDIRAPHRIATTVNLRYLTR